jgi:hypothetical protein
MVTGEMAYPYGTVHSLPSIEHLKTDSSTNLPKPIQTVRYNLYMWPVVKMNGEHYTVNTFLTVMAKQLSHAKLD